MTKAVPQKAAPERLNPMTSIDIEAHVRDDKPAHDLGSRICRAREMLVAGGTAIDEEVDAVLLAIQQAMRVDGDEEARAA